MVKQTKSRKSSLPPPPQTNASDSDSDYAPDNLEVLEDSTKSTTTTTTKKRKAVRGTSSADDTRMVRLVPKEKVSPYPGVARYKEELTAFWTKVMMALLLLLSLDRNVSFDGASSMLLAPPLLIAPSKLINFRNNQFPDGLPFCIGGERELFVQSSYLKSLFKDGVAQSFAEVSEKQSEQFVTFVCYTLVKPIIINIPPSPHY